jgi:hypothetical protein
MRLAADLTRRAWYIAVLTSTNCSTKKHQRCYIAHRETSNNAHEDTLPKSLAVIVTNFWGGSANTSWITSLNAAIFPIECNTPLQRLCRLELVDKFSHQGSENSQLLFLKIGERGSWHWTRTNKTIRSDSAKMSFLEESDTKGTDEVVKNELY